VRGARQAGAALYLVHRPASAPALLFARISPEYLWSSADDQALPGGVRFALLAADSTSVLGAANPDQGSGSLMSASWVLPETAALEIPSWRIELREPRAEIVAAL